MEIPKLELNKCSVIIAEYATGHVFKRNLLLFQKGEDEKEVFQIFRDYQSAKDYVIKFVQSNPKFECTIFDHNGHLLFIYNLNGEQRKSTNL